MDTSDRYKFSTVRIWIIIVIFSSLFMKVNNYVCAAEQSDEMIRTTHSAELDTIPCQATINADERFKGVRAKIIDMIADKQIPSMAIAVAKDGKIIWEEAIGWADTHKKIGATVETVYPLASLSKSIMATGVMTLVEKGVVRLEDPVEKYLTPGILRIYEGNSSDLKIKHVLSMMGGIPHGSVVRWEPYTPIPMDEFVSRYILSVFPPGEVYHYSNYSMGLSEPIVCSVTGKNLAEFMDVAVFEPLGMERTFVKYPVDEDNVAVKYNSDGSLLYHVHFGPLGGAGFYSSVQDLIKYGMFFLKNRLPPQKKILKDKTIDTMHTVHNNIVSDAIFGLGWGAAEIDTDLFWIMSNGEIYGACSNVSLVPSENLAVACLANVDSKNRR